MAALLEVRDLQAFYGQGQVLRGVNLQLQPGEIVSLLGRNGSGRSTTLKAIMGLVTRTGSVRFRGEEIGALQAFQIARRGVGYVPENRDVFPTLTVEQNLVLGEQHRSRRHRPAAWTLADMYTLFPLLRARRHTAAGVLSGGEQQMLTLCRTLMGDPDLMLVDEPTEGLAPSIVAQVAECLQQLQQRGIAVLLVEQKLAIALAISRRVHVLGHGAIVFEGTPAELAQNDAVRAQWLEV